VSRLVFDGADPGLRKLDRSLRIIDMVWLGFFCGMDHGQAQLHGPYTQAHVDDGESNHGARRELGSVHVAHVFQQFSYSCFFSPNNRPFHYHVGALQIKVVTLVPFLCFLHHSLDLRGDIKPHHHALPFVTCRLELGQCNLVCFTPSVVTYSLEADGNRS
jgi:hypothetical protein